MGIINYIFKPWSKLNDISIFTVLLGLILFPILQGAHMLTQQFKLACSTMLNFTISAYWGFQFAYVLIGIASLLIATRQYNKTEKQSTYMLCFFGSYIGLFVVSMVILALTGL